MITKKQKLQALDESILLKEVMMMLFSYKAGERTAEYVAEDIIYLVRESYKQPKLVQSDEDKQYKDTKPKDGWGEKLNEINNLAFTCYDYVCRPLGKDRILAPDSLEFARKFSEEFTPVMESMLKQETSQAEQRGRDEERAMHKGWYFEDDELVITKGKWVLDRYKAHKRPQRETDK